MRIFFATLFFINSIYIFSQDLLSSRTTSYYTYIYKITDKEAFSIYKEKRIRIKEAILTNLVDSFPTDSVYRQKLLQGHYVKVYSEKNKLNFSVASVHNFDLKVIDNNTDLCVQIYDSAGNIIPDAKLKIRGKSLRFNTKLQAYVHRKSNKKGLLKVDYQGNTFYFDLERKYNNSEAKRIT